jgi:hypothetical protein
MASLFLAANVQAEFRRGVGAADLYLQPIAAIEGPMTRAKAQISYVERSVLSSRSLRERLRSELRPYLTPSVLLLQSPAASHSTHEEVTGLIEGV